MKLNDLPFRIEYLLGPVMIAFGILSILANPMDDTFSKWLYVLSRVFVIIFGIAITLDPRKNILRAVGLYALALGLGRAVRSIDSLTSDSDIIFFTGFVLLILGLNLMYGGVTYFKGTSKNATNMTITTGLIILAYFFMMIFSLSMGIALSDYVADNYDTVSFLVMYSIFIVVLMSDEVRANDPMERIYRNISWIESNSHTDGSASISREDLKLIERGLSDKFGWKMMNDGGPVEAEINVTMHGETDSTMIVQKWKDLEGLFVSVVLGPNHSFIQGLRFNLVAIRTENGTIDNCDHVRLYSGDGKSARLRIYSPKGK
ncbi:MAG: hypothetical protein WCR83_06565 [Candidatus Methanomethylophilaceae archaeon]